MQNVALAWLVLSLSRSPLAVATLLFCRFAPYTLFGLFAGSIVDRLDTRRLVVWTQVAAMVVSAALALVTLTGTATLPIVFVLATLGGVTLVLDAPARQVAHVRDGRPERAAERRRPQLGPAQRVQDHRPGDRGSADRSRRASASVSSSTRSASSPSSLRCSPCGRTSSSRSPAIAPPRSSPERGRDWRSPGATARCARCSIVVTCVGLVGFNFNTLVPLLASDTLHVDARAFGLLSAAFGLGAFAGAIVTASFQAGDVRRVPSGALGFSVLLLALAPVHDARLAGVLLVGHRRLVHPVRRQRQRARPAGRSRPSPGPARRALPVRVRRPGAARLAALGHARRGRGHRPSRSPSRASSVSPQQRSPRAAGRDRRPLDRGSAQTREPADIEGAPLCDEEEPDDDLREP